ncbi:MAG TPA: aminoacyl-tRNA hydrolase [Maribacter sp.]|uniref:aminoacyl-tRNA hydrolase n=1 Tax=unclassified Maribacter TaxID=2615042 RepID=UPI000ECA3CD2|nr:MULTISPECIES: aminoacyl-tRNA hydrolase [unclassified Maribacter]HAF75719.1 aminoacyl-tRNA hydrolase [Maribacter sp.]HAI42338.1 aminoacyl-tRNA hydrolase [Maribacter sp.]|tara:strand:- start:52369 stop:52998 length:630 start_codon:yes stop_codon:yes gene_type:complete
MLRLLKSFFTKQSIIIEERDPMKKFLIVGLGNIGEEYTETRHNIGFKILDEVAKTNDFTFETAKLGDIGSYKVKGRTIICLKPSTYMNRSGKALKYWMDKENIPQCNVLVITDDINLPFGTIRIKTKGSNGGHNGLKDVELFLQTIQYNRYRFGVGSDFGKGRQVEYVLGQWNSDEQALLPERLKKSTEIINSFALAGIARTMNQFNNS